MILNSIAKEGHSAFEMHGFKFRLKGQSQHRCALILPAKLVQYITHIAGKTGNQTLWVILAVGAISMKGN